GTNSPEAQDLLLRATAAHGDDTEQGMLSTIALLERAIALDPGYAEAHAKRGQYVEIWASTFAHNANQKEQGQLQAIEAARGANGCLGKGLLMLGPPDEALRQYREVPADDYHRIVGEAAIAARAGRREDALTAIPAIERRYADAALYQFAPVYAQVGLVDQGV